VFVLPVGLQYSANFIFLHSLYMFPSILPIHIELIVFPLYLHPFGSLILYIPAASKRYFHAFSITLRILNSVLAVICLPKRLLVTQLLLLYVTCWQFMFFVLLKF
jgi:hypothetical protein